MDRDLAGPAGELSLEQKHAAFEDVLLEAVRFGDYDFPVAVTQSQRSTFAPEDVLSPRTKQLLLTY